MKKLVVFVFLSLVVFSCSKVGKGEYIISGTAKGIENGKTVILQTQDESGMITLSVDTVKVENEKFEIKGKIKEPAMHTLFFPDYKNGFSLIVENGEIDVVVVKDSMQNSKISGTYNNDEFQSFNDKAAKVQKKMIAFQNKNMTVFRTAQEKNDTVTINKLVKENNVFQDELKKMLEEYPSTHPKSFISLYMLNMKFNSPDFDLAKMKKEFNSLDESLKKSKPGRKIQEQINNIEKPKVATKTPTLKIAPDFLAKSPEGKTISLKESLGKVTIIDFWASWCGPCRKENPSVVALYNELHSKGLNIVGVSLDDDLDKWKEAIIKDKITWIQVSNLKKWADPIAKLYNVEQIPCTFILDSKGNIVAQDLRGDELKTKVEELLAVK
jgi:thiol-disulfide isomerase/thioredoxin